MSPVGICAVCQKSAAFSCAACHNVMYCKKEHQKEDWPNHKVLCRSYEVLGGEGRRLNSVYLYTVFSRIQTLSLGSSEQPSGLAVTSNQRTGRPTRSNPKSGATSRIGERSHAQRLLSRPEAQYLAEYNIVKSSSDGGQYVVATRNIKKGNVIIDEIPLVIGPTYLIHRVDVCPGCHHIISVCEHRCSSCNWPVCKRECPGLVDPTRHGAECAVLSKIKKAVIGHTSEVILPLRSLLLQKNDPEKWKAFLKMAARAVLLHTSTAANESMDVLQESLLKPLAKIDPEMLPDCSKETVRKVYAVLSTYGVQCGSAVTGPLYAVCPVGSLVEHSCLPNSRTFCKSHLPNGRQSQTRVVMRATKTISKGENITTLYVDTWMSTHMRQASLWQTRKVLCGCSRCLDPRELGTDFGTLRCTNAGCRGWVLSVIQPEISPEILHSKCETCGQIYSVAKVEALNKSLRNMISACTMSSTQDNRKEEDLLARLEKILHPNHHYCLVMKRMIADQYGQMLLTPGASKSYAVGLLKRTSDRNLLKAVLFTDACRDVLRITRNPAIVMSNWQEDVSLSILHSMVNDVIDRL